MRPEIRNDQIPKLSKTFKISADGLSDEFKNNEWIKKLTNPNLKWKINKKEWLKSGTLYIETV